MGLAAVAGRESVDPLGRWHCRRPNFYFVIAVGTANSQAGVTVTVR